MAYAWLLAPTKTPVELPRREVGSMPPVRRPPRWSPGAGAAAGPSPSPRAARSRRSRRRTRRRRTGTRRGGRNSCRRGRGRGRRARPGPSHGRWAGPRRCRRRRPRAATGPRGAHAAGHTAGGRHDGDRLVRPRLQVREPAPRVAQVGGDALEVFAELVLGVVRVAHGSQPFENREVVSGDRSGDPEFPVDQVEHVLVGGVDQFLVDVRVRRVAGVCLGGGGCRIAGDAVQLSSSPRSASASSCRPAGSAAAR